MDDMAWDLRNRDPETAYAIAKEMLPLADALGDLEMQARAWNHFGLYFQNKGDFEQAVQHYQKGLELRFQTGNPLRIASSLNNLGIQQRLMGRYKDALSYFLGAQKILDNRWLWKFLGDEGRKDLARVKNNIGVCYKYFGRFEDAQNYFSDAARIWEGLEDFNGIAESYLNQAGLNETVQHYDFALHQYEMAKTIAIDNGSLKIEAKSCLGIGNIFLRRGIPDSAFARYGRSLQLAEAVKDLPLQAIALRNQSLAQYDLGDQAGADTTLQKALSMYEKSKMEKDIALAHYEVAKRALAGGNDSLAIHYLVKSLEIIYSLKIESLAYPVLESLNRAYEASGDSEKAFVVSGLIKQLLESYPNRYRKEKLVNEELNNELQIQELRSRISTLLFFVVAAVLGLVILSLVLRQKSHRIERQKQEYDELFRKQQELVTESLLRGHQEERDRLSEQLHDDLGGTLSMIVNHFKGLEKDHLQFSDPQFKIVLAQLEEAVKKVRQISQDLSSQVLSRYGLVSHVETMAELCRTSGKLEIDFIHHDIGNRINTELLYDIYRLINESVTNTVKHARASKISVQLICKDSELTLMVEDDGIGFDITKLAGRSRKSLGMENLKALTVKNKGELSIDSSPGNGTTIIVNIPL